MNVEVSEYEENGMGKRVELVADDGRRMGVCVAAYRSRTHLVILDLDNPPWFLSKASLPPTDDAWVHAVAALPIEEPDYHWDSPRYRELCIEGGLDPDEGRPAFGARDEQAANELLLAVNRTAGGPSPGASNILLDLIDLMRTDDGGHRVEVEGLRLQFANEARRDPKVATEVLAVIARIPGMRRDILTA